MGMGVGEFWMLTQDEIREVWWGRAPVPICARLGVCALPSGNMGEQGSYPSIIDIPCLGRDGPAGREAPEIYINQQQATSIQQYHHHPEVVYADGPQ